MYVCMSAASKTAGLSNDLTCLSIQLQAIQLKTQFFIV